MTETQRLLRTPLYESHVAAGGRMVDFAGWEMPVQYIGVMQEHRAVRTAAGLFDVSHMGEFRLAGEAAEEFLQKMTPNDVSRLQPGRIHYSGLLTERGTYIDDLLVYRLDRREFLLVVNAANVQQDFAWLKEHLIPGVALEDVSSSYGLLALQGPKAEGILSTLATVDLSKIRYYGFAVGKIDGMEAIVSRTGYTGEDGFELYVSPQDAARLWDRLLEVGQGEGLLAAGLGARDTLRLEAGMALYGHEIDDSTTPLEANLQWVVKTDAGEFMGREALIRQRAQGLERRLVGFELQGRGIGRAGHSVVVDGKVAGSVTSGTWSPTFERAIGMAYVPVAWAEVGGVIEIEIRGRLLPANIVPLPFYRRSD